MEYREIKIREERYLSLVNHENECSKLFEAIVRYFVSEFISITGKSYAIFDSILEIEQFVNLKLKESKVIYNGKEQEVWQNTGGLMYWEYKDSRIINIDDLIRPKKVL